MPKWTKKVAIERLKENNFLQQIMEIESRLVPIVEEAKNQTRQPGYNRIQKFVELRNRASAFVGLLAEKKEVKTREHLAAVIAAISDLLPPDKIDLADDDDQL